MVMRVFGKALRDIFRCWDGATRRTAVAAVGNDRLVADVGGQRCRLTGAAGPNWPRLSREARGACHVHDRKR